MVVQIILLLFQSHQIYQIFLLLTQILHKKHVNINVKIDILGIELCVRKCVLILHHLINIHHLLKNLNHKIDDLLIDKIILDVMLVQNDFFLKIHQIIVDIYELFDLTEKLQHNIVIMYFTNELLLFVELKHLIDLIVLEKWIKHGIELIHLQNKYILHLKTP